jgi:hypothetical protein
VDRADGGPRLRLWGASLHGLSVGLQVLSEQNRLNIGRHNAELRKEAAASWAPWQERYRALRTAGWAKTAAREEIGGRISADGREKVDDKTLRKWLSG